MAATTSVEGLLSDLGEQITTTGADEPARDDRPGRRGRDRQDDATATEPTPDVTVPELPVDTGAAGSATGEPEQAPGAGTAAPRRPCRRPAADAHRRPHRRS